jgi:hypothetical protein
MWMVVGAVLPPSQASGYANIIVGFVEWAKVQQIVRSLARLYKEEKQKTTTKTQTNIAYIHRERFRRSQLLARGARNS